MRSPSTVKRPPVRLPRWRADSVAACLVPGTRLLYGTVAEAWCMVLDRPTVAAWDTERTTQYEERGAAIDAATQDAIAAGAKTLAGGLIDITPFLAARIGHDL